MPWKISVFLLFLMLQTNYSQAQYKALITNLNTNDSTFLKTGETFYFGHLKTKQKGTLEAVNANELVISGTTYKISDIDWIDYKGRSPKKNTQKIAQILFYFGGGVAVFSAYNLGQAADEKDKRNSTIVLSAGAGLALTALAVYLIPKQPQFNFTKKHLLEILPVNK